MTTHYHCYISNAFLLFFYLRNIILSIKLGNMVRNTCWALRITSNMKGIIYRHLYLLFCFINPDSIQVQSFQMTTILGLMSFWTSCTNLLLEMVIAVIIPISIFMKKFVLIFTTHLIKVFFSIFLVLLVIAKNMFPINFF